MFLIGLITRTGTCQVKENERKHWLIKDQQFTLIPYAEWRKKRFTLSLVGGRRLGFHIWGKMKFVCTFHVFWGVVIYVHLLEDNLDDNFVFLSSYWSKTMER